LTHSPDGGGGGDFRVPRAVGGEQWELDEEELFEEEVEWGVPEGQEAEELLATHATSR
jgi:hypothetical protein